MMVGVSITKMTKFDTYRKKLIFIRKSLPHSIKMKSCKRINDMCHILTAFQTDEHILL